MKRYGCLLALLMIPAQAALADNLPAGSTGCRVVGILDGDTITCLNNKKNYRIRLVNIDAPEKNQAYGQRAKAYLAGMIFHRDVTLQKSGTDRYGRTLATVYLQGQDINLKMVQAGYAWAYRSHPMPAVYRGAELAARTQRLGLWQDPHPVYPGDFRHQPPAPGSSSTFFQ